MPTNTIRLVPGLNLERTPSLNESAYQATQLIRFEPNSGLPQKLGGWTKFYPQQIDSIVRTLNAWEDTSGVEHMGVGCASSLNVITNGFLLPITPQTATDNVAPNFTTTIGSNVVTVVDASSNATVYDVVLFNTQVSIDGIIIQGAYPVHSVTNATTYTIVANANGIAGASNTGAVPSFQTSSGSPTVTVTFPNHGQTQFSTFALRIPVTVGGITLSGFYTVTSVTNANVFLITAANQAVSNDTQSLNGGNVQIVYYLVPGQAGITGGYGVGPYGSGAYGVGSSSPPARSGVNLSSIDWSLSNWGGFLIASQRNGPIFVWDPNSGLNVAQMIPTAPVISTGTFVSMPAQILVAFGAEVLGIQDPLLIRWSTNSDYTTWVATVTNQAGSYRLTRGSRIVGAYQGPQYALIWTDLGIWSMTYIGQPFIFDFSILASGCGLIGKFAAATLGTTVFWMSQKGIYALPAGGSVTPVPCTVWDFIFQNLDTNNVEKIRCAVNSQFNEVGWFFPSMSGGTGENDSYIKFNMAMSAWDCGTLGRSAWIDQSELGAPIGANISPIYIYQHETSPDADGQPMLSSFTTGYWAMSDGEEMSFCDLVYPDMKFGYPGFTTSAEVQLSFNYADNAQDTVYTTPQYTMTSGGPGFLNVRLRGRLMSLTLQSSDVGTFWRLGGLRARTASSGRL